jgi:hypothetical protein
MSDYDDETESLPAPASVDRFADVLMLLSAVRSAKQTDAALRRLRRLERDIAAAEHNLAAITLEAEQTTAALVERQAALAARERTLDARETEFEASLHDARDNLRGYYDDIAQADKRLRYRLLANADLLHGYNERLQTLPDWPQIKRMIPDLPVDPPTSPVEMITEEVREDWTGNIFLPGSTLTRTINKAAGQ